MKRTEMIYIKESRENSTGFLHHSEQVRIESIMGDGFKATPKTYWALCDDVLSAYDEKWISNKQASEVFEILMEANRNIRKESHRFELGNIFEYDCRIGNYVFSHRGSRHDFNRLNCYL